jgi:hypothetical protein
MQRRTRRALLVVVAVTLLAALIVKLGTDSSDRPQGVTMRAEGVAPGYTLYSPLELEETLLVDGDGSVVHRWPTTTRPGLNQFLLGNGNLLRAGNLERRGAFGGGQGAGGRIEEVDPDGDIVWRFDYADDEVMQHHDLEPLPNGNVLFIAWERVPGAEAIAAGRDPGLLPAGELWPDKVVEYSPATDQVVWEWRVWDHLVQDHDPAKPNYGDPAEHPGRIDVNFLLDGNAGVADWNHLNAVTYNAARDEIMLSSRSFSEIWVIDHSIETAQAAGPAGDLRFRFGNPRAYGTGTRADQQLFVQHDPVWIPDGFDGSGDILVFSNGLPDAREFSSVEQITPQLDASGDYAVDADHRFVATMERVHPTRGDDEVFAAIISGAQRLSNGNTLVVYGNLGRMIEVTPAGQVVWDFENPYYTVRDDTPSRTGAGFVIEPWWTFRALRYAPDHPGIVALGLGAALPT